MNTQMTKIDRRKEKMSSMLTYVGGGIGLGLFAVFGILNASFVGGIVGINIAGAIMGLPLESNIISRIIVAIGMLSGVMVAGLIFISAGAVLGWVVGKSADYVRAAIMKEHLKGTR